MSAIRSPCWSWASYRRRPVRSASSSRRWKSDGRRILRPPWTRLRSRGRTLCLSRPAHAGQQVAHQHLGAGRAPAGDARLSGVHRSGGPNVLRTELPGFVPAHRRLCRQDSTRGEARRPSGRAADQVRAGCQSDHREGARHRGASDAARPRRRGDRVRRREFITLLGGAAAWPLAARAQQTAMPVIGFLSFRSEADATDSVAAFRKGLGEVGYIEGRNVAVEYRWADARLDRLPMLAEELVRLPVAVLAAVAGQQTPRAAQTAPKTIPIVFGIGEDPVKAGLVPDINRPPGNMTGVTFLSAGLGAKRLGMLRQLVPDADLIGLLANQNSPQGQEQIQDVADAAKSLRQQLTILNGSNDQEIDAAFTSLAERRVKALLVAADPSYDPRRNRLIALSEQYAIPTLYHFRDFLLAGGLACYGASISDLYRQVGIYVGRILHGDKPADLPVMLPTKFEFVINLKTARALKLDIPPTMLALADEVIE